MAMPALSGPVPAAGQLPSDSPGSKVVPLVRGFEPNSELPGAATNVAWDVANFVRRELDDMSRFRTTIGLDDRIHRCAEMRDGRYTTQQLQAIRQFGGSEVYARLVSNKVRGSYSILSQIFTSGERPWEIGPTPEPTLPEDIYAAIKQAMMVETQTLEQAGQPVDEGALIQRAQGLIMAARDAALRRAKADAEVATRYLDDILVEGGYYEALREFLIDFCTYPFACLNGPVPVMRTDVRYVNGVPQRQRRPVLEFRRVNPSDILWTSGATRVEDAAFIERSAVTRAQIGAMIGLPGFDENAVRSALRDYQNGHIESQFFDARRDKTENQETPGFNDMLDMLTYIGAQPGWMLADLGIDGIDDEDLDYLLQVVMLGQYVFKIQIDPDPRARVPYYIAAYEPVPGSIAGNALPELMQDIAEVCNATARALVNNVAISSGPQVALDMERIHDTEDPNTMYPWKIWKLINDPSINSLKPIEFFQPTSNIQDLISMFQFFSNLGDEVSAIPRFLTGNERVGGAGRTASGLSMLMGNANRSMISIAGSVDNKVQEPLLQKLYDLILLVTGTQVLRGDENIVVRGATLAEAKETDRMRQLEFLQMTMNPIDTQIMGIQGRANVLRSVSKTLGMEGDEVVPTSEMLLQQQQQAMMQQQAAQQGGQNPDGSQPRPKQEKDPRNAVAEETDNMHRTRER